MEPEHIQILQARHPHWEGVLRLSLPDGQVLDQALSPCGRYVRDGAMLTVYWDDYAPDIFFEVSDIFLHEALVDKGLTCAAEQQPRAFRIVSQYGAPCTEPRTELLPAAQAMPAKPVLGSVIYDAHCVFIRRRHYAPLDLAFAPLYAWHIADAILTDMVAVHKQDMIYADSSIHSAGNAGRDRDTILADFSRRIHESGGLIDQRYAKMTAMAFHNEGGETWGHFVIQNLPRALVFLQKFPHGKLIFPRRLAQRGNSYFDLLQLCGIALEQLVLVEDARSYRFGALIIADFPYDFPRQIAHPAGLAALASALPARNMAPPQGAVFLERTPWTGRLVENQAALDALLEKYGVRKIRLGEQKVQAQIAEWGRSALVIAVLGSDLTNMVFAHKHTRLLVLSPDWFADFFFYNLATLKGLQWNELRCGAASVAGTPDYKANFLVDLVALDVMLASLLRPA